MRRPRSAAPANAISASLSGPFVQRSPVTITSSGGSAFRASRVMRQLFQKNPWVGDKCKSDSRITRAMRCLSCKTEVVRPQIHEIERVVGEAQVAALTDDFLRLVQDHRRGLGLVFVEQEI